MTNAYLQLFLEDHDMHHLTPDVADADGGCDNGPS